MYDVLSVIAGILFFAGYAPYIWAIWRDRNLPSGTPGKTQPSKSSWIIWASLDTITAAGMFAKGTLNGQIVGAFCGAWVIVVLAIRYGTQGWKRIDKICLGGATLGLALWAVFSSPLLGIITSQTVVFVGAIPTITSAWEDPKQEDKLAWTLWWVSCLFALAAVPQWTLADAVQPVVFTIVETIMMYILYIHARRLASVQASTDVPGP